MICTDCRDRNHVACKELRRQVAASLSDTEKSGSAWCDCQHWERANGK